MMRFPLQFEPERLSVQIVSRILIKVRKELMLTLINKQWFFVDHFQLFCSLYVVLLTGSHGNARPGLQSMLILNSRACGTETQ